MGNAALLTWNGQGHTSYLQGSTCVDNYVNDYLVTARCRRAHRCAREMTDRGHCSSRDAAGPVRGVALVLHGGRRGAGCPSGHGSSPCCACGRSPALRRAGSAGLVVARLRYRVRGWNGAARSPVPDGTGRSTGSPSGSRTCRSRWSATRWAAGPRCTPPATTRCAVVGLAPWIEPGDPVEPLAGRRLLVVHGDRDRMTTRARPRRSPGGPNGSPSRRASSRRRRAARDAAPGRRSGTSWRPDSSPRPVLGRSPDGSAKGETANVLAQALAGEAGRRVTDDSAAARRRNRMTTVDARAFAPTPTDRPDAVAGRRDRSALPRPRRDRQPDLPPRRRPCPCASSSRAAAATAAGTPAHR